MTDLSPILSPADQKRAVKRRVWALFGIGLTVVLAGALLVASLRTAQVGIVSQVMTMVICFLPTLLVLLVLWLAIAAAMFGVSRLEVSVTRQLAGLEGRAQDAQIRARTAGEAFGRAVSRVVARTDGILRRFSAFDDPTTDKDVSDEQ